MMERVAPVTFDFKPSYFHDGRPYDWQYYDIVVTVEPKRLALAEANDQLNEANST